MNILYIESTSKPYHAQSNVRTIATKINVTPNGVRLPEKLQLTAVLWNVI